jgi:eukaryotic-like serine/threonine-protein kinase
VAAETQAGVYQIGDVVEDRFDLLFPISSGGMGVVWRARDLLEEGEVAVKEIRFPAILEESARTALSEKLVAEARIVAGLEHPGLVRVVEVLEDHQPPLVVTELVEGPSLADMLATEGPLSPERVAVVGLAAVEALAACSAAGLSHRFVRPSRILLPFDGPVRLADFGVAALVGDPDVTSTGAVADSAGYLAPEHRTVPAGSAPADLWALGVTLYTAVEGEPPFTGETAKATLAAIVGEPPRPTERAGTLAPVLQALLAKRPEERPDHARLREMLAAVALVSVGAPSTPMEPAEALDRMFARDPDTPQLHLMPPDTDDEPPGVGGDGSGGDEALGKPPAVPPPKRKRDVRRRMWTVVCALSIVGMLGSLLAAGGQKAVVKDKQNELATQWLTHQDDGAGYSIEHPGAWSVSHDGNLTDFRDPTTGAALRVGYQQPPQNTPQGLWLQLEEQFKAEHPSYARVRLSQSVHEGYPAAVWEFTWTDNGVDLHNYDLAFTTGPQSFALNFQSRESDWLNLQPTFDRFIDSFQPPAPGDVKPPS